MIFKSPQIPLTKSDYIQEIFEKRQIVLHHTASLRANNLAGWWNQDGINGIATAFGVDVDGTIYQYFPEQFWSYHTGNGAGIDKYNIGLEIANFGHLTRKADGKFYSWTGNEYTGKVYTASKAWRGQLYFAEYTEAQYKATAELVKYLCCKYTTIPKQVMANHDFNVNNKLQAGIVTHANVWSEKLDVSVAWNWDKFQSHFTT